MSEDVRQGSVNSSRRLRVKIYAGFRTDSDRKTSAPTQVDGACGYYCRCRKESGEWLVARDHAVSHCYWQSDDRTAGNATNGAEALTENLDGLSCQRGDIRE